MNQFHPVHTHPVRRLISALALSTAFAAPAFAQADPAGGAIGSLLPLVLILVIFYFLLIRPQQKRLKAHKQMIGDLKKGDKVVTGGGIFGTVHEVAEDHVKLDIADGVRVKVKRDTISGLAE